MSNSNNPLVSFEATSDVSSWGTPTACDTGTAGPEFAHAFIPPKAGSYTVKLTGLSANLDPIIMEAGSGGSCNPTTKCVAAGTNAGTADESVTFTAAAGKSYFLVVDGQAGAISNYTIAISSGCN